MSLAWESVPPFTPTGGQRPPPTFAASRQRRDLIIAQPPEGVSKEGGPQPSLFGRFKGKRFLRKGGNRNPPFLKPFFGYFLSGKKVTRRRQKKERKAIGRGRTPPLRTSTESPYVIRAGRCGHRPLRKRKMSMRYLCRRTESSAPTTVYRTHALSSPCHSEPVTDVTGVGIRSPRPQARNIPCLPLPGRWREAPEGETLTRRTLVARP